MFPYGGSKRHIKKKKPYTREPYTRELTIKMTQYQKD